MSSFDKMLEWLPHTRRGWIELINDGAAVATDDGYIELELNSSVS